MIEVLIDNIFVQFGGRLFCQVIGIPMGTNCAPLLIDLSLYSYENEFLDNMIRSGHRRLARLFNLCYRYINDLIVFNNKKFLDYLKEIYPSQLTVVKANKSDHLADYLDISFIIDSGGKLSTRLYDKRGVSKPKTSKTKTSKTKTSKTKTSKAKTSKTKTPEYFSEESFVFVFFPTVHLSCQYGMSKKC